VCACVRVITWCARAQVKEEPRTPLPAKRALKPLSVSHDRNTPTKRAHADDVNGISSKKAKAATAKAKAVDANDGDETAVVTSTRMRSVKSERADEADEASDDEGSAHDDNGESVADDSNDDGGSEEVITKKRVSAAKVCARVFCIGWCCCD
jgi:hypothetical protein